MGELKAISSLAISGTYRDTSLDHSVPTERLGIRDETTWNSGNSDIFFSDEVVQSTGGVDYDLNALVDAFGNTLTFATLRQMVFETGTFAAAGWQLSGNFVTTHISASLQVPFPGHTSFKWENGKTITVGSSDTIRVTVNGTITYRMHLIGKA